VALGVSPDGLNINQDCGSTAPQAMCAKVREVRADFGIALDGDADRVVMADEEGRILDGDQILALIAKSWSKNDTLKGGGVVGTVMSNAGLDNYLGGLGLKLARAAVGDRYVQEVMLKGGFNVGGEQSGHVILSDFGTTGDGTNKDTAAFQKAFDACASNGGGEVLVPPGNYLIGSVQMGSRTILALQKGSVITGSADMSDYPMTDVRWEGRWEPGHRGLIYATNADNVMIGGEIIGGGLGANGAGSAKVLIRGLGPSLTQFQVPNALSDPTLELHDGNGAIIASNDNWKDTQQSAIQATGLAPSDDRESAILTILTKGSYTAILRGKNNTTGIALIEAYKIQ